MSNFRNCLVEVLKHEGGFVNDPQDRGGATNLGVTIGTLSAWLKRPATIAEVRALNGRTVEPIYRKKYWDVVKGDQLPVGLDLHVFDHGVNAGNTRSVRILQGIVGATVDGKAGPMTLAAVAAAVKRTGGPEALIVKFEQEREAYYRGLRQFPRYGRGWLRRNSEVTVRALAMARSAAC